MTQVTDFCKLLIFDHVLIKNNQIVDYYTSSKKKTDGQSLIYLTYMNQFSHALVTSALVFCNIRHKISFIFNNYLK